MYGLIVAMSLQGLFFIPAVKKAGFSPWWIAPTLIPGVGVILLWLFAFAAWPVEEAIGVEPPELPKGLRVANHFIAALAVIVLLLSIPMVAVMAEMGDNKQLWQGLGLLLAAVSAIVLVKRSEFALLALMIACAFFFVSCAANFHWGGG
jgi:hypothetical protein